MRLRGMLVAVLICCGLAAELPHALDVPRPSLRTTAPDHSSSDVSSHHVAPLAMSITETDSLQSLSRSVSAPLPPECDLGVPAPLIALDLVVVPTVVREFCVLKDEGLLRCAGLAQDTPELEGRVGITDECVLPRLVRNHKVGGDHATDRGAENPAAVVRPSQ